MDILTGPHNFKILFEDSDLVLKLGLELGLGLPQTVLREIEVQGFTRGNV